MKQVLFVLFIVFFYSTIHAQSNRLSEQAGAVRSVKLDNNIYNFELANGYAQVIPYSATTIRVRVSKTKFTGDHSYAVDKLAASGRFISKEEDRNDLRLFTDSLMVVVHRAPFRVSFYNNARQLLNADDDALGVSWYGQQVSCYKKLQKDEKFVGLGEKTGPLNRRGNYYSHWNADVPGYAVNADPLYSTIPFFVGIVNNTVYGIFFDNTHRSYFNFGGGADEELYHFGADDGEMNYYFFGGSTVEQILKDYTALTGRTYMPPLWSFGFQQSRWGYDSQEQLLSIARLFREKKMPADVIVSDIPYMDNYKIFTWNTKNFDNVKQMNAQLKRMGFDMVVIIDPGIKIEKGYKAYEDGVAKNYFAKYPDGRMYVGHVWPGRCHFPDFVKPEVRKWWGESFRESYVNNGVRGFWNDMNEPAAWGREFPNLIEFGEGKDKATLYKVKNAYGLLMSKATYEGTKALMNGQRPFTLTRAAYAGIQKYSAMWTGDNVASDEHMMLGFRLLNSMGVSGVPYVGMDIGGFVGNPSPELFIRWMSLGVYTPFFRNHTHIGYNYREPWQFGEQNTNTLRSILEQRYRILPYLYSSFYQSHLTGMPLNRMLPITYTHEANVYDRRFENQFLFGDNILVAPVESSRLSAEVYFPGNHNWYRLTTGEVYKGGSKVFVGAPLHDPPVFVKEGAIIPMQNVIQHTKEKGDGVLLLHVWKGNSPSSFTYYEDDGDTFEFEKGVFYKRMITYNPGKNAVEFAKKEGSYPGRFKRVELVLHGFDEGVKAESVALNDGAFTIAIK